MSTKEIESIHKRITVVHNDLVELKIQLAVLKNSMKWALRIGALTGSIFGFVASYIFDRVL